ncbi:MAG: aspartate--tRNA ligase [Patescibacteria group bacterium]|nr:aspartate--tRNA ligase [Patescibacteria group bacterium]
MERILNRETPKFLNKEIKVCGWVDAVRLHGKIIFIDLRDRTGILQLVFTPKNESSYNLVKEIREEFVIEVIGIVSKRPAKMINAKVLTGSIEVPVKDLKILSKAKTLPFSIQGDGYEINEEKRMKYRYLDLRRQRIKKNIIMRQKTIQFIRNFLIKEEFVEIETPILTKSTPEGARDFVIPSRLKPGMFYALPQSPQQYKQLLQVAGFEKYFQIARCFRDEDPRADRQAEFTQLDLEMSFMSQKEILALTEQLFISIVKELFPEKKIQKIPFPRIPYAKAMEKYNTDKPDLRKDKNNGNELAFAFVVDFPMFEWKKEEKRWGAVHHPFTRPQTEDIKTINKEPDKILAYQYDLVLNGYEIGGGSLRSYNPETLEAVFKVLGHKKEEIHNKFGHLLEAFKYGVPPHGGIAPGLDRFFSILFNEPNIREVIAFPKTGDSRDLMMGAPAGIDKNQLKELNISVIKKKQTK